MKKFCFLVFLFIFLVNFTVFSQEEKFDETINIYDYSHGKIIGGEVRNIIESNPESMVHVKNYVNKEYLLKYNSSIFNDPIESNIGLDRGGSDYYLDENYNFKFTENGKKKILNNGFKLTVIDKEDGTEQSLDYDSIEDAKVKEYLMNKVNSLIKEYEIKHAEEMGLWREAIFKQIKLTDELLIEFNKIFKIGFFSFTQGKNKEEVKNNNTFTEQDLLNGEYNQNPNFDIDSTSKLDQGKRYFTWILLSLLSIELLVIAITNFFKGTIPLNEVLLKTLLCIGLMILITNIYSVVSFASSVFIKGGVIASNTTKTAYDFKTDNKPDTFRQKYNRYLNGNSSERIESNDGEILIRPSQVLLLSAEIQEQLKIIETKIQGKEKNGKLWKFDIIQKLVTWIIFILAKIVLFLSFLFVAVYIMLWQIELRILIIIATFLLPFKIFRYTDFLAKGIWGTLLGQCVKLFTAAFLINISELVLKATVDGLFKDIEKINFTETLVCIIPLLLLICGIIAYFVLKIPETARALLIGQPTTDGNAQNMLTRSVGRTTAATIGAGKAVVSNPIRLGTGVSGAFAAKRDSEAKGTETGHHTGGRTALSHGVSTALTYGLIKAGKQFFANSKTSNNNHPKMDGASNKIE